MVKFASFLLSGSLLGLPLKPLAGIKKKVNPVNDSTRFVYSVESTSKSSNSIGSQEDPVAIPRCEGRHHDMCYTTPACNDDIKDLMCDWQEDAGPQH